MNFLKTTLLTAMATVAAAPAALGHSPADTVVAFDVNDVLISGKKIESQELISETWELVEELRAAGYPLYIFSNINSKKFERLQEKFPGQFDIFEGHHVFYKEDQPFIKPNPQAYAACKAFIAQRHAGKHIVFIDDKAENVQAALKAGIRGVQFSSGDQLKAELRSLL